MPFKIIRNDITKVRASAIVNTANPRPVIGSGTDSAIYEAAGRERLLEARNKIGPIEPGKAAITPGFGLPAAYIIHTVGPLWEGGVRQEQEILADCYRSSGFVKDGEMYLYVSKIFLPALRRKRWNILLYKAKMPEAWRMN